MGSSNVHAEALAALRRGVTPALYARAVDFLAAAPRTVWFGIGPTSHMALYAAAALRRFGLSTSTMTRKGLLAADDLADLRGGDRVIIMAYGYPYAEVTILIEEAERHGSPCMLITDAVVPALRRRCEVVLLAPRGRADALSLHAGTLALVEALLVGVAAKRPDETSLTRFVLEFESELVAVRASGRLHAHPLLG